MHDDDDDDDDGVAQSGCHTPANSGHTCYGQLTPIKTKYLLTSITGTTAGFRLDRGLMSG